MKAMHTHFWKTMFKDMVSFQMESASPYRKQKFTKQREGKEKLEVRPSRMKGASLGVSKHVSTACRPHLAAASHLYLPTSEAKTHPGLAAVISPASKETSVLLHAVQLCHILACSLKSRSLLYPGILWITRFQSACCSSAVCLILGEEFLFIPNCLFKS